LTMPPSSPIYVPSTVSSVEDWWTSLRRDSPASPTATPESERVRQTPATSGPTLSGSLARYDPAGCCWKTYQASLTEKGGTAPLSSATFPLSGMTQDGVLYPLPPLVRPISDGAGGVWLGTPTATELVTLPTPATSTYWSNVGGAAGRVGKERLSLEGMARKGLWPTPIASRQDMTTLEMARTSGTERKKRRLETVVKKLEPGAVGGQLNPTWVEWLMGLPIGWTDLKPLAMESYQQWLLSF
ncbi:hypothetical protein LCGC14_1099300, partial [marine sediment metagenome]